tara:strand:- start:438 stop:650 length:213 start_codon:yes stop_codon:yes gene_type:complete
VTASGVAICPFSPLIDERLELVVENVVSGFRLKRERRNKIEMLSDRPRRESKISLYVSRVRLDVFPLRAI